MGSLGVAKRPSILYEIQVMQSATLGHTEEGDRCPLLPFMEWLFVLSVLPPDSCWSTG